MVRAGKKINQMGRQGTPEEHPHREVTFESIPTEEETKVGDFISNLPLQSFARKLPWLFTFPGIRHFTSIIAH